VKKKNEAKTEILVKWSNVEDEEATWENYEDVCMQFPKLQLEDKLRLKGRPLSGHPQLARGVTEARKGAVSAIFEFKYNGAVGIKEMGCDSKTREIGPIEVGTDWAKSYVLSITGGPVGVDIENPV
jgi:Chromo (CHRromatin Organisation MOdifier) domain